MKRLLIISLLAGSLMAALPAQAQLQGNPFSQFFGQTFTGNEGGKQIYAEGDLKTLLPEAVGNVISLFLSLIGVILLVIVVYAGFLWLTAGGNEDQVARAKQLIRNGVIGLIIALSAYLITGFVVTQVQQAISTQGAAGQGTATPSGDAASGGGAAEKK